MMLLRTVLGAGLAVVLGAAAMPPSTPFGERLLAAALIGGPGFVVGGLALAYVVDAQEGASMSPWTIRLTTLLLGVAFGALNILLAAFVGVILLGPFWGLGAPMILRGAAVAGGVGLGLGAQIGIHGGPR